MFFTRPLQTPNRFFSFGTVAVLSVFIFATPVSAQDHTILFSPTDPGVPRAITNWGVSVTWPNADNTLRSQIFMTTNEVDFVHLAFITSQPLTNGDLTTAMKAELATQTNVANLIVGNKPWSMAIGTGSGVDAWYKSGSDVIAGRWVQAMEAAQRFYGKPIIYVEPFNEPDYGWGQGTTANLFDILGLLQTSTNFPGTVLAGGSTLNCDQANIWYDAIKTRATAGTSHALAGSFDNYVGFMQNVIASGDTLILPEAHNLMEVVAGAEYGVNRAMYWGAAELARGNFVKACQGRRLGYSEDRAKWTAAAVYRGTNGNVQAFVGASERMATTTSYQFFSKDRDVFYDGDGPRRDFTVTIPGGTGYATADQRNAEKVVNITWGADVPPVINGRYLIVNRNSGKVLEVPGAGTGNGIPLDQTTYTGALNQQWDVNPIPGTLGGDYSYYSLKAAHSGVTVDLNNFSYANGAAIQQWNGGTNAVEQWYFQYTTNGWFKIRSKWSNKVMGVNGASTNNGALILQWDDNGTLDHEWRFIPTNATVEFVAPAAPTLVTATASAVSVQLNWKTNSEADLASYTVLRSTNSGGPYDIVARGLTNNSFADKSANQAKTFFYVVKAADKSLNTSGNSAQVSATPSTGPALVARYSFNGSTNDSSGNANHPILTCGTPTFVAGKFGAALNLSGTGQYTMLPAGMFASVTNFTIATWVFWSGGAAWQRIFDFGNDTTQYMFLTPSSGSGTLRFAVTTNGGGAEQILQTTSALPTAQWVHVAVTRNGNIAQLYTNGIVAVSATNVVTIAPGGFNPALNYLGKSQYPDPLFNGRLDELFIYNYALSATEIARLTNNLPPPPSTPTTLVAAVAGNALNFFWPSNYLGCRLQVQTNSLGTNWFTVANSSGTNQMLIPISPANGSVFYRLIYP